MSAARWQPVLSRFHAIGPIVRSEPLTNAGGFSGSDLWRVATGTGEYCLRRWPTEHPSPEQLTFIHAFQRHLRDRGLTFVPVPLSTSDGGSFVSNDGHLWELTSWMPGKADLHTHPTPARLAAAMTALARIHAAAAQMPGQSRVGSSPGLMARLDQLRQLLVGGIERIETAIARRPLVWDDLARRICQRFRVLAPRMEHELVAAVMISGPLFPCLRDIWHDHVLFTGDEVTGVIDYGAVRIESPVGDIARLVRSLVGDDRAGWNAALAAYQSVRELDANQRQLIGGFDASGLLLSGINWLTWLYVEEREFEDKAAVTRRLEEIVSRM